MRELYQPATYEPDPKRDQAQPYVPNCRLPGAIAGLPAPLYHASVGASSTLYRETAKSPHHVFHRKDKGETKCTRRGSLLHAMTFEPATWRDQFELMGDRPISASAKADGPAKLKNPDVIAGEKALWAEKGKAAYRDQDLDMAPSAIEDLAGRIRESQAYADLGIDVMRAEVSWYAPSPSSAIGYEHTRTDGAGWTTDSAVICDLKTMQDGQGSRRAVRRKLIYEHLDLQAVLYREVTAKVLGIPFEEVSFAWLCVETETGATSIYPCDEAWTRTGLAKLQEARERLGTAMATGEWTSYNGERMVDLPPPPDWALDAAERGDGAALLGD